MGTVMKPVQNAHARRRQWSREQKLTGLQEWQTEVLLEEICRKYEVNAAQMYRWKRSLDQGLKESGKLVPKSLMGGLQKRVEELERPLGRKTLEVDVLKKPSSSRGSNYPRRCTVVNAHDGLLRLTGEQQDPDPPAECRQRCSTRQRFASLFLLLAQNFTILMPAPSGTRPCDRRRASSRPPGRYTRSGFPRCTGRRRGAARRCPCI
jgi:transposase